MKADDGAGTESGLSTRAVHAGSPAAKAGEPVVAPIHQTSTFFTDAVPDGEVKYTRYGTNPNHVALNRISTVTCAVNAFVLATPISGPACV